jgi:hypothetical protein
MYEPVLIISCSVNFPHPPIKLLLIALQFTRYSVTERTMGALNVRRIRCNTKTHDGYTYRIPWDSYNNITIIMVCVFLRVLHNPHLAVRSVGTSAWWYGCVILIDVCELLNDAKWLTSPSYLWFIRRVHGTALRTRLKIVGLVCILFAKIKRPRGLTFAKRGCT